MNNILGTVLVFLIPDVIPDFSELHELRIDKWWNLNLLTVTSIGQFLSCLSFIDNKFYKGLRLKI